MNTRTKLRYIALACALFTAFAEVPCGQRHCRLNPPAFAKSNRPIAQSKISGSGQKSSRNIRLTVLFFNDLHGHLLPYKSMDKEGKSVDSGGIAGISALVKEIRAENMKLGARTLLLVAGDVLQGTPLSTVFKGRPDIEILNVMGVDAMTVGNHEFDFGLENFIKLKKSSKFPFISSNIVWKDTGKLMNAPSASFRLTGDCIVTVIGATTTELLTTTSPANVDKVDVIDSIQTVAEHFSIASSRGPVILLSHSKYAEDVMMAKRCPGLTAIIGGHDQILFEPLKIADGVPMFQAFEKGRYLGRLDLIVDNKTKKAIIERSSYIPITPRLKQDPDVAKIVESYVSKLSATFKEVIGESPDFMDGERGRIRFEETNLGNFVADVMREYTGSDMAFINAGSLRASLDSGPVTIEDIFRVMPYSNELVVATLTGGQIIEALNRAVRGSREDEDGGFLHVSGIFFKIHGKKAGDVTMMFDKSPVKVDKNYTVAITDFLHAGGDGYTVFAGKPAVKTGLPLRELLVDSIRKRGTVKSPQPGRIIRVE